MQRMVPSHHTRQASNPPLGRESLAELLRRARGGELDAFDSLVRAYYPSLLATATHLLGNREDAEDLVQDTFVDGQRALGRLREDAAFEGWLRGILVHKVRDRFRRQGRGPAFVHDAALEGMRDERHGDERHGGEVRRRETSRLVRHAIERLPERLRITLSLRALDGRSYDEIADATGVTPATSRTRVMKARRLLVRWLESWWGEEGL